MSTASAPPTPPLETAGNMAVLIVAILGSSMAFIDGTIVNVALPALQSALRASSSNLQWVVEAYALSLSSLLLVGGSMGDIYGRRKIFLLGVSLFAAGSAWCGFVGSVDALILARGVQGIGAAFLVPGSLSLISAAYPSAQRGRAIGTWSGFTAITAATGPVFGGWLVEHISWRAVFFINVPLAALVIWMTIRYVHESRNMLISRRLDWPGALLACVGLGGVTYALIEGVNGGMSVLIAALAGLAAMTGFIVVEARSLSPMVPLALFKSRTFSGANLITLFLYSGLGGVLYFLPLNLIQVQHYSATQAGAALLPLILIIFLLSRWSGGLIARHGSKGPLTIGSLIVAVGFGLLAWPGIGGSYWATFFAPLVILGLGMAICVAPLTTSVMNAAPENQSGVASGVNNAVSRVAGLIAVALFGLILSASFNRSLSTRLEPLGLSQIQRHQVDEQRPLLAAATSPNAQIVRAIDESFVAGYRVVVSLAAILALASAVSAMLFLEAQLTTKPPAS
ncbi:MFS transporter [Caballeronia sp. dw_276]|uniref:MFS transporter n=1 Tax=Caballeronia sp. dw_276 TaxID=2719795 RepID=UPI002104630B|nr:MFS transporter [Caballeronia sp. dw_276]